MTKTILLATILATATASGCHHDPNTAEILAKSKNRDLVCETTSVNHIEIAVCYATSEDKKVTATFLTAAGRDYPFQACPLPTYEQVAAQQAAEAKQQQAAQTGAGTGSATPTPPGTGSGSATNK